MQDLMHALSRLCRFGGHRSRFYSTAEHALLAASFVAAGHPAPSRPDRGGAARRRPQGLPRDAPTPVRELLAKKVSQNLPEAPRQRILGSMPEASTFLLFAVASAAVLLIPGPAVLFIVARTLEHGRPAGLFSVLGIHTGSLVHVLAAAVGLSALLASSATAFAVIKYLGAAYLVYLGIQKLRHSNADSVAAPSQQSHSRVFWQGAAVQVLNPKTAVFFLAFLPQFVDADRGPLAPQIVVLGLCFIAIGALSDSAYALAAGAVGKHLRHSPSARRLLDRISGGTYVALGGVAAFTGERVKTT